MTVAEFNRVAESKVVLIGCQALVWMRESVCKRPRFTTGTFADTLSI